ncbi:MAG TPA: phosphatase PAP2 family protein [Candidatus Acidoferrales bacterium]|jgi:acid phosphatase (class A)|nr:phosphatase PAP2 family protein [Candidatus Acidoferrales bacterium]
MRTFGIAVFATCIALSLLARAGAAPHYYYLHPNDVDLTVLLPPPPDPDSVQEQADDKKVANVVANRTPIELADAMDESKRNVFFFAPSVGAGFAPEHLPLTTAFFKRIGSDVESFVGTAKSYWNRPRPPSVSEKHGSYPSGHAAFAASTAIVLAEMLPEKRNQIFLQARLFAENRIILGVHYPTDIAAGWTTGTLAVSTMMRDKTYLRDYKEARTELRKALGLPA